MFTETMFASKRAGKSVRNFTCAQVFATDFGWIHVVPMMMMKKDIHKAFKEVIKKFGVPTKMIMDGAQAQVQRKMSKICDLSGCKIVELEKRTPASNRAEREIQTLKHETRNDMKRTDSHLVLW